MKKFIFCYILLFCLPAFSALKLTTEKENKNFIFDKDPKAMATTVSFVIRSGSIDDPKGKEGLANISFSALLRGTKSKNRMEYAKALEQLGADIEVNAGYNRAVIQLTTINENLQAAVNLLSEAVLTPGLRTNEVNTLTQEALAKIDAERSNNRMLLRRALRFVMYRDTPLAYPPQGTQASLKAIKNEDIKNFLKTHLVNSNIVVAVSTNQEEKQIKNIIEKAFQNLPAGNRPPIAKIEPIALHGRQLYIVPRADANTTEMVIDQHSFASNYPQQIELNVGQFIFGDGMTSRVFKELRDKTGWAYIAQSGFGYFLDAPRSYGGSFSIYANPRKEFTEKTLAKAVEIYENYIAHGLTEDELYYAKNALSNSYAFAFATSVSRVARELSNLLDDSPLLSLVEYRNRIHELNNSTLGQLIKKNHQAKDFIIVAVGDEKILQNLKSSIPGIDKVFTIKDPLEPTHF